MSDKSVWQGIGNLVGGWGKPSSAKPLATSTRRCEAGHPMAMDWVKCPYCEAARNAGERTRINDASSSAEDLHTDMPPRHAAGATRINTSADGGPTTDERGERLPPAGRRETRIDGPTGFAGTAAAGTDDSDDSDDDGAGSTYQDRPAAGGAGSPRGATRVLETLSPGAKQGQRRGGGRRLTGIVVTFTWSPLGQLFEVHEGRNYGGSGTISSEGQRDADILVTEDSTMSNSHFLILCQGGKYRISDCNSTNGTYVDGELIDPLGIELADGAQIQAGATLLTFKKILPPSASRAAAAPVPKPDVVAPEPPHRRPPSGDEDPLR